MDLTGKTVLITGASRGIGAAIAQRLAACGANLALCGRDPATLERTKRDAEAVGARAASLPGDMSNMAYVEGLPEATVAALGRLDVVVNNAGVYVTGPSQEADLAEWDHVLDVNFRACVHLTRFALPILMEHDESAVINICSVAGRGTFPEHAIYCATKHAMHAWSSCLWDDVRLNGVKVCTIYPGYVDTVMVADVPGDHGLMIQPADVAHTVQFALEFPTTSCPTEIVIRGQRMT